ncbi:uncharacterized protein TRUGW13939_08460 [Talaromyces rugulosus]|uniref:Major facilitator superfamily (MFS) profile domain-containing protein n=1 Tax=Talaromyces rugulosus TaxID=121627 RepID=A0A7H8R4N7_TALRU|nr:uncharacterized protein TRUGW13939_08460 [Talaromyces rugulosus]QKX61312.1 hypothetical protein TRUGW13939_08460 [Talaromyces rugulosus]
MGVETTATATSSMELSSRLGNEHGKYIDKELEKKLLRKLDIRIIPILWCLFLVSFFDRSNIGNAKISGMTKALKMEGNDYNIAVTIFTVSYVVFGVPANLLVKKFGPKLLAVYMFCWGLVTLGQGLTKTTSGLIACRFVMGMFEAGFVPGCAYLISCYYKRNEFLRRYAVFFSANMAAGAFNGLFSTLLAKLDGRGGLDSWQWIFVMEAIITMGVSIIGFFIIVPFPENASFLTADEKALLEARMEQDGGSVKNDQITFQRILPMLADWKIWVCVIGYMSAEETASSLVAFQPTILKDLGWTSTDAQWHTIPVYATSFVFTLSSAWLSDYLDHRFLFTVFGSVMTIIGWSIQLAHTSSAGVLYMAMFFVSLGAFINMSTLVVWLCTNMGKGVKRTVAMGILTGFGNCGAFVSGNVFITNQSPKYPVGFGVGLAFAVLGLITNTIYYFFLNRENSRRDKVQSPSAGLYEYEQREEIQKMGDAHPDFRYQL